MRRKTKSKSAQVKAAIRTPSPTAERGQNPHILRKTAQSGHPDPDRQAWRGLRLCPRAWQLRKQIL